MSKFILYDKVRELNKVVSKINKTNIQYNLVNQLERAASSIFLNIAEGDGRFGNKQQRQFFIIARGSTNEVIAIMDLLIDQEKISTKYYKQVNNLLIEIMKILYVLINKDS